MLEKNTRSLKKNLINIKIVIVLIIVLVNTLVFSHELFIVNSQSETISKYDTETYLVENHILAVGQYANQIYIEENTGYIVNSGEHNIQVVDLENVTTMGYIQCPNGSNPYWVKITESGNKGYVSGMFTNSVFTFNPDTYEITGTISVGNSPEGLCLHENKLYVMNSSYGQSSGSVSVIDTQTDTVLETITVGNNPQFAAVDSYDKLHVVCTGNYGYSSPAIWGEVYVININDYTDFSILDVGASPTRININDEGEAFLADGNGLGYIIYNTDDLSIEYSSDDLFSSGGAFIAFDDNDNVYLGDAIDWVNNGMVRIYNSEEVFIDSFNVGVAPVDGTFLYANNGTNNQPQNSTTLRNYPNPFKRETTFYCNVKPQKTSSNIKIFNIKGQIIDEVTVDQDTHLGHWDAAQFASGVYFYKTDQAEAQVKKLIKLGGK